MAEAILYGAASNILSGLMLRSWQKLGSIFGQISKDLEKLRGTVKIINAVIVDAEKKQESDYTVKEWIHRLEDVLYDADDLMDEFDYAVLRQKVLARNQVREFFSSSAFGLKMSPRIKEIRGRLDKIIKEMSILNLSKTDVVSDKKAKNTDRETASKVRSELIIGREKDKKQIIESLLQEQNDHHGDNISIVAIVGFGGLGKTSLAQLVYNDVTVKNFFSTQIWVCVSEEFDVLVIFKKILKSLIDDMVDNLDLDKVQRKLEEILKGKRYLLVLDDVWNEDHSKWDKFSQYLVLGAPGSKILVTTRSKKVVSAMRVHVTYPLEGLNEDQSLTLFEQVAFEGQDQIDRKLKAIGEDVAQRCKGVPLAIKCLGSLMRENPNEEYWLTVKENEIWKLDEEQDNIFPVLKLSYIHLPSHLKQCFAFCSIFPKDFKISKDLLIRSWRAQGYIQDIGDKYFNDLLSRSFFQEEVKDKWGNIVSCKMHDLIHDLALLVAKSGFCWMKDEKDQIPKGVRHVSLGRISEEVVFSDVKGIRTIFTFLELEKLEFIKDVSRFNCLRMLNLREMKIENLSNSIGELKHLRYLDLSGNLMEVLPDGISRLYHLQTLLLENCMRLQELSRDIGKLISLEYLNIDGCRELECLPKGLGDLTSLTRLDNFIVNRSENRFSNAATLNELRDLNDLGNRLSIINLGVGKSVELESKEANLKAKKRIHSLELSWIFSLRGSDEKDEALLDNLEPHLNLKELEIADYSGARFSSWLSSLSNLVNLTLIDCNYCQHLPPLDHLSSLQSLSLVRLESLEHLPPLDRLSSFQSLSLESLKSLEYMEHSFSLPYSVPEKPFLPSLKKLVIEECPELKGWWRTKDEKQAGSTPELPYFPCLSQLVIRKCPNLTSMPLFPSLDQELTLWNTSIRPLQETLKMKMKIKMREASITSEASSSSSTNTRLSYTNIPLSNLKRLTLHSIHDTEAFSEQFWQNMNCLTSLLYLKIRACPNLRALPNWIPDLTSLKKLKIHSCHELQYLPQGMHHLTSLQELEIGGCPQLSEKCQKETGIHWSHIAHIPKIYIDRIQIQDSPEHWRLQLSVNGGKLELLSCGSSDWESCLELSCSENPFACFKNNVNGSIFATNVNSWMSRVVKKM